MSVSKQSLKRGLLLSLLISAASILLILAFTRHDFSWSSLKLIKPQYMALGILTIVGAWSTKVLRLMILCRAMGHKLSFRKLFDIYMSAVFIAHVTPSTSGGVPLQIYLIHKEGMPVGKSSAASIVDSGLTTVFLAIAGPILIMLWKRQMSLSADINRIFNISVGAMIALTVAMIVLLADSQLLIRVSTWFSKSRVVRRFMKPDRVEAFSQATAREVAHFSAAIADMFRHHRLEFALAVVTTVVYWCLYLAVAPVALMGLGIRVPIVRTILAQIVFNIVQPFFPTPGGSGGSEIGFAFLFKSVVPRSELMIFVSVWRFFTYYLSLAVGGLLFYKVFGFKARLVDESQKLPIDAEGPAVGGNHALKGGSDR